MRQHCKLFCKRDHLLSPDNVIRWYCKKDRKVKRTCRTCALKVHRDYQKKYRERARAA